MGRPRTPCGKCGEEKAVVHTRPSGRVDYGCRPCMNAYGRDWSAKNKERVYVQQAARRYSIDEGEARRLRSISCEACGGSDRMVIDHCHKTGRVRGALCGSCNSALGYAKDDPNTLRALARYIEERGASGQ